MQAGNSRFLERRMQWEEGAGNIFQLQSWGLVVLSGSSPAWDKHCVEEISSCPAPQEFLISPRVGSDPRAGGKTFLVLF